jgi:uncharacterized protein YbjT (DUF2867 family)
LRRFLFWEVPVPDSGVVLVTGATGKQGGAVARHLLDAGRRVRALTRDPQRARRLADRGAEVVAGDMTDPASLARALESAAGVYAMSTPFEQGTDAEVEQGRSLADAASAAGVRRFVVSSVIGAKDDTGIPHIESKGRIEDHIRSLDFDWTFLRPVFFMENFLAPWIWPFIRDGTLALAMLPETKLQLVAVDDIGAYGAAAFDRPDETIGQAIPIASDERTGAEIAEAWSRKLGREVRFQPLPLEGLEDIFAPSFGLEFGRDLAMMWRWFNSGSFPRVDIPAHAARWRIPPTSLAAWLDRLEPPGDTP